MTQLLGSEPTSFSVDNMGRFLCNTLQEALDSAAQTIAGRRRKFGVIDVRHRSVRIALSRQPSSLTLSNA